MQGYDSGGPTRMTAEIQYGDQSVDIAVPQGGQWDQHYFSTSFLAGCVNLYMSAIMQADISWKQCANV